MAGVFLSYDRDDSDKARPIAFALEKAGHSVWWDLHVRGGAQFGKVIEEALKAADAVVVLWSVHSVESAWVRDEAAAGRDSGRLIPVTIDGTEPPLGFRQFQTIDLSKWRGRSKAQLERLLEAVASYTSKAEAVPTGEADRLMSSAKPRMRRWLAVLGGLALVAVIGIAAWVWMGRGGLPVVEVAAANPSARSQAAASDLFVKLGSLAQLGEGKWQLVDAASAPSPDLVFRTADTGSPGQPQANLVLLDGKDNGLLWSREFSSRAGSEADLRQQLSFTAGRVLSCALESRAAGGLPRDLLKLFLNTCANLAEAGGDNPMKISRLSRPPLRAIIAAKPRFIPAWGRLLYADAMAVDAAELDGSDQPAALRQLRTDMNQARRVAADVPELTIAELKFLPITAYERSLALLAKAAERTPDSVEISTAQSIALQCVGRMSDAIAAARRAAALDPLSPTATTELIMTLAYAGQLDEARKELARAERLWAGTDALRDAQWGFYLRFGDPKVARQYSTSSAPGLDLYFNARADPTSTNVERLASYLHEYESQPTSDVLAFATQALAEFDRTDDVFRWVDRTATRDLAETAYLFFRPAFDDVRRDPRFMPFAKRIGLVDYWRTSGKWPDFCDDPALPYNCKAEAAKLK